MNWSPRQIRWAKRLDALFNAGSRVKTRASSWRRSVLPEPAEVRRILFVKFWGIGSIVLTQPALRLLGRRFPNAEIHFLTVRDHQKLLELMPEVDRVHGLRAPHLAGLIGDAARAAPRLRHLGFDLIFDAEFLAAFSGWLCRALKPGTIVGFGPPGEKRRWQDFSVPYLPECHAVEQFLNLARVREQAAASRPSPPVPRPRLRLPESSLVMLRPYFVLNVNASPLAWERRWPRDRFLQLANALLRDFELDLILIGSRREKAYVDELASALDAPGRVRNLAGRLDLEQLAEVIANASALVSNDSGPVHLASAYDVPTVAFFGPESPLRYGPLSTRRLVFYQELPCSPCMSVENAKTVNCRYQQRCMTEIRAAPAIASVLRFIASVLDEKERIPQVWQGGAHA